MSPARSRHHRSVARAGCASGSRRLNLDSVPSYMLAETSSLLGHIQVPWLVLSIEWTLLGTTMQESTLSLSEIPTSPGKIVSSPTNSVTSRIMEMALLSQLLAIVVMVGTAISVQIT